MSNQYRESAMRRYSVVTLLLTVLGALGQVASAGSSSQETGGEGYLPAEGIPVSCLDRTLEYGEHVTDDLGNLKYVPFAVCNETSSPLSLHYGTSETITCTVAAVSDELYHILEFYVHSDAPMSCRVPTAPLSSSHSNPKGSNDDPDEESSSLAALNENGPSFTPVTMAMQGTLQLSHLHIWTDMNVLLHNLAADPAAQQHKGKKKSTEPGYVMAGTAYSVPEFDAKSSHDKDEQSIALVRAARDPWTSGHGTKVIRGEPLTFAFHVAWVEGGASIGWPARTPGESFLSENDAKSESHFFSRLFFFVMAASVGALAALHWERNGRRWRRGSVASSWRGEGMMGGLPTVRGKGTGVAFGNGGRINGYGGYSPAPTNGVAAPANAGGHFGYAGFGSGKKD
ncbi:uncharacterized protein PFLUO_LOCUS3749 [Penicillium psychrofluorescens]|uniref:uncharacterized protein n=1 Tax=Penicillium psychrofluorescens TaxID=3158075 RepID=UPI003CCE31AC